MRKGSWLKIGALILGIAAIVGGLGWFLTKGGGQSGSPTDAVADLPADTVAAGWCASPGRLLSVLETTGLVSKVKEAVGAEEYAKVVEVVKADPLTREGLLSLGIDLEGKPAIAYIPGVGLKGTVLVRIPMQSGGSGVAIVRNILIGLVKESGLIFNEEPMAGHAVLWVLPRDGGAAVAAVADLPGASYLLVPVDPASSQEQAAVAEVKRLIEVLANNDSPRLGQSPVVSEVLEGSKESIMGMYVNGEALSRMNVGDRELQMLLSGFASASGMAFFAKAEGKALTLEARVHLKDTEVVARPRDREVLKRIPGSPIAGMHVAVDSAALMRSIEKGLAMEPSAFEEYLEAKKEIREELELPPEAELQDVLDGEFGLFFGDFAPSPEFMVRQFLLFIGLKDQAKLQGWLNPLLTKAMQSLPLTARDFAGAQGYVFNADGVTVGAMFFQNRLWVAGDLSWLESVAKGDTGKLLDGERTRVTAGVMGSQASLALYIDLRKLMAFAVPLIMREMPRSPDPYLTSAVALLNKLDYVVYSAAQEGPLSWGSASVYVEDGDMTAALAGILAGPALVAVPAFTNYTRKAKTTEAIVNLDMIYKGAAMYYSTPRVEMDTGRKLECQFPRSVDFTPTTATCCKSLGGPDADGDDRCDVNPSMWDNPTWAALNFQLNEPHYYSYRFQSNGLAGAAALFTVTAVGDLDCDGIQSTFERYGYGDAEASYGECTMRSDPAIYSVNETE